MRVSSYVIGAPLSDERFYLLLHGIRGTLDKVPARTGAFLVENRGKPLVSPPWDSDDRARAHLTERGYLTDLPEENERQLLVEVATALHDAALALRPPSFFFVPAYTCNLRCPYCFQPHEMHAGRGVYAKIMSHEQVDDAFRVIDHFDRPGALAEHLDLSQEGQGTADSGSVRRGALGLFGGEPLQEQTRDVIGHIARRAAERGATLRAVTNAVQLDLFTDLLGPDGLAELQITLDGMSDLHDRRRVGPRFRKTFQRIVDNIDLALARGARVMVRVNVDRSNADELARMNAFFLERGWGSHRAFSAEAAVVTGDAGRETLVTRPELVEVLDTIRADQESCLASYEGYAHGVLSRALSGRYPFTQVANCGAETGMLMFDPRGDVYSCWDEVGFAEHRVGTYHGGTLHLDHEAARAWLSRFPGAIDQCSRCPYALIHTSGCAKQARDNTGSLFAAACEGFQSYFPRTLATIYEQVESCLLGEAERPGPRPPTRTLPIVDVTHGRTRPPRDEVLR
ncbi:uncharacterized protein LX15_004693 [Streptoalloteichus tenebrarius]|uniref:Radical SAM core domain-containing protein n=1 Tax=Streptoalloteichus tenebrarius (strain ATCC 17920 / DSM 40477 / JCM 4838 / CBS 697.72 / NBRC 16177 / NCIMB 11028 / NRRL B-12390 / A12253. 1 / ISP 5477) TaxID=1933 RepID=A0ABT1HZL0_STRSD|nr:SPASM domain-containing protein [Streptoalloteichus tenebrarius]MCP2260973.1 uncharacterized protein [Streptoalloteichus tenebrarius]BFE98911.1 radical SAM protein [Streptoalloteichus tenebrarius]